MHKLTEAERRRLDVIEKYQKGKITGKEAAFLLDLSERQVSRVAARFRLEGPQGILRVKGPKKKATHSHHIDFRTQTLDLVKTHYSDYGSTLAAERLSERFGLCVSKETLRRWRIQDGAYQVHVKKPRKNKPLRARRPYRGEMVQIDGSLHDWFEGRAEKCTLLVFVDDATSEILYMEFATSESLENYSNAMIAYMKIHGKPRAIYTDRHGVFSVNDKKPENSDNTTNFNKSMSRLGIQSILAYSPEAKGRVERMNSTMQDRLVKALREQEISSLRAANAMLPSFIIDYNRKKKKLPAQTQDAHEPLSPEELENMAFIFSIVSHRTVPNSLVVRFEKGFYRIINQGVGRRLQKQGVKMYRCLDGSVVMTTQEGEVIEFKEELKNPAAPWALNGKELEITVLFCPPVKDTGLYVAQCERFLGAGLRNKATIPYEKELLDSIATSLPSQSSLMQHNRLF